jgi:hypothetical protein
LLSQIPNERKTAIHDPLILILIVLCPIAKENQTGPVRCPGCHLDGGYVKYGFYERYLFESTERIKVQRYLCKNPGCETVTFSILPHPFLRYVRFPLCFFLALLIAHEVEGRSIASLAKSLNFSCGRVRRAIKRARELKSWLFEINKENMPWSRPCLSPPKRWTDFLRVFSFVFYPGRYGQFEINTT